LIYPNPGSAGNINIHLSNFRGKHLNVRLIDPLGHLLFDQHYTAQELSDNSDVNISAPISNGLYIVIVSDGKQETKRRIVIRNSN
jgi:hypothetical protein